MESTQHHINESRPLRKSIQTRDEISLLGLPVNVGTMNFAVFTC